MKQKFQQGAQRPTKKQSITFVPFNLYVVVLTCFCICWMAVFSSRDTCDLRNADFVGHFHLGLPFEETHRQDHFLPLVQLMQRFARAISSIQEASLLRSSLI